MSTDRLIMLAEDLVLLIPEQDHRDHTETSTCWCEPVRHVVDGVTCVVHRPLDHRYDPLRGVKAPA